MSTTDDRLMRQLAAEVARMHPELTAASWELDPDGWTFRIASPVEPCEVCGHRVYLILVDGDERPRWVRIGPVIGADSLFPEVTQIVHECGDGDAWSVEAALFTRQTMTEWACS